MRKVIALEFITLDGVIQAGGGPEEDTSGGFAYGGWQAPYSDAVIGAVMPQQMSLPFDLLCGKRLFVDGTIPAAFKVTDSQSLPPASLS